LRSSVVESTSADKKRTTTVQKTARICDFDRFRFLPLLVDDDVDDVAKRKTGMRDIVFRTTTDDECALKSASEYIYIYLAIREREARLRLRKHARAHTHARGEKKIFVTFRVER